MTPIKNVDISSPTFKANPSLPPLVERRRFDRAGQVAGVTNPGRMGCKF
jgi:hypothetical protein